MSGGKESFLAILGANLVLTVLVVGAALAFFTPEPATEAPADTAKLEAAVAAQQRETAVLRDRIAELELANQTQAVRIEELARTPTGLGAPSSPPFGGLLPTAGSPEQDGAPTAAAAMQKAFGDMIRQQAKRARDRYISELMNPTPESEARQARQVGRIAQMVAQNLGLEPRDRDAVELILTDVDERRRSRFRELAETKQSTDDITFEEVKTVLDESFEEEDRLIADQLTEEKVEEYLKTAQPFRSMILMGAQAAFPTEKKEE